MRLALYYPHTKLHTENILKRSLLLWDRLEYIVPEEKYKPDYKDKRFERALELFGTPRLPTDDEKKKAHDSIMEVFSRPRAAPARRRRSAYFSRCLLRRLRCE